MEYVHTFVDLNKTYWYCEERKIKQMNEWKKGKESRKNCW